MRHGHLPEFEIFRPKRRVGNFYNFDGGFLIADPKASEALRSLLEMAGELLPLPYEEEVYTVLNVTRYVDCLDHEETTWAVPNVLIKTYAFRPDRLSESPIFKIPEDRSAFFSQRDLFSPRWSSARSSGEKT